MNDVTVIKPLVIVFLDDEQLNASNVALKGFHMTAALCEHTHTPNTLTSSSSRWCSVWQQTSVA